MCLVVMTFVFYELSGGADFVPRSELRQQAAAESPIFESDDAARIKTASLSSTATSSTATLPQVTSSRASRKEAMAAVDSEEIANPGGANKGGIRPASASGAQTVLAAATPGTGFFPGEADSAMETPGVTLVSLADNPSLFATPLVQDRAPEEDNSMTVRPTLATAVANPVNSAPDPARAPAREVISDQRDIRAVDGNRVNMRNGPGTNYSVLAQLDRSTKVEILADPGDGWVKLRPINGGPVGWMADYLLSRTGG